MIFLGNCSIDTVLEKDLSRKQNTRRVIDEESMGSGKLKIFHGISGYDRFFTENWDPIPLLLGPKEEEQESAWCPGYEN